MTAIRLAAKWLLREGRAGEWHLLLLALVIAVGSTSTVSLFSDRLHRTLQQQAADFLAGDLAVSGSTPLPLDWQTTAKANGLDTATTVEFSSVLMENEALLLASVKAVSDGYPLRGHLTVSDSDYQQQMEVTQGPEAGSVWVDQRVLSALNRSLGENLTVGTATLRIAKVVHYEPDKRGDFYSFSPRVMLNQADLAATQAIQPGSHAFYSQQWRGNASAIASFKSTLKAQLNPSQRLLDLDQDRPELGNALQRMERYLGLCSIVIVVIAGVAIAMASHRYSERHLNTTALMRCLGCSQTFIVHVLGTQLLLVGVLGSSLGCGLGWLAQQALFSLLQAMLPQHTAAVSGWGMVMGVLTGLTLLLGFGLPPLLRLKQVSPLRVLRRELSPRPAASSVVYGLALTVLSLLLWRYTGDMAMTARLLASGCAVLVAMTLLLRGLLHASRRLLPRLSLSGRMALQGLLRHPHSSVNQLLAFSITLTALTVSSVVRNDLVADWQQQLPANAPNYFALNLLPDQVSTFENALDQAHINRNAIYPVVRGRLVAINDQAVKQRVSKDSQGEAATQRDLSLTWREQLPSDTPLIAGSAWTAQQPHRVSVEQKLAKNLGIQLGDQLRFSIGSEAITATVSSLRQVNWDSMHPNFYMIFSPGSLDAFPSTYLTSFYLPPTDKALLNGWIKQFPALTLLEVDHIVQQLQGLLKQLTQAINVLLVFALSAGSVVLITAVYNSLDMRLYETALMRTLGAKRQLLRRAQVLEFGLLGSAAGLIAALASEAIVASLYLGVLHLDYHPQPLRGLGLIVLGGCSVSVIGWLAVRQVVNHAPLPILRQAS